jgi:two-component system NtrC family response regulator
MAKKIKLLFVDDEEKFLKSMTERLKLRDLEVFSFSNGADALEVMKKKDTCDVALIDLKMPEMDGEALLKELKNRIPEMEVIILTGHGSIASAKRTTQTGAYEYLQKPCDLDDIISSITSAYAKRVKNKNERTEAEVNALMANVLGLSPIAILEKLRELDERNK